MNYSRYIKSVVFSAVVLCSAAGFTSCQKDIELKAGVDESKYESSNYIYGFVQVKDDNRTYHMLDMTDKGATKQLHVGVTKSPNQALDFTLQYDATKVAAYNESHKTDFPVLPANLVTIADKGEVVVAPGDVKSNEVKLTVASDPSLTVGQTYLVPIAIRAVTANVRLNTDYFMVLVKYGGSKATPDKESGIKIISCMEINDTNPLNNLPFTLKNSGKPLVDILVLFSANINYNAETGRVYLNNNENITAVLANREKYLKPLQDKGMKIVLSIMGNHDMSGVANMATHTAMEFAQELKTFCDAYQLDGIFYDDEYSKYPSSNIPPAFVAPSSDAAARLCYEVKRIMPDKINMAYMFGATTSFKKAVDGVNPGDFIDYGVSNYGDTAPISNYLGITVKQMAPYSQEFIEPTFATERELIALRNGGYGAHMIFAMDPNRGDFGSQKVAMSRIATLLFDDELVDSGERYKKDW